MKANRLLLVVVLGLALLVSCHRQAPPPPPARGGARVSAPPKEKAQALILVEAADSAAAEARPQVKALRAMMAHFDALCDVAPASSYRRGQLPQYRYAFYLAGDQAGSPSADFLADLAAFPGIAVWVGPGLSHVGPAVLADMGLTVPATQQIPAEQKWTIAYHGHEHAERLVLPDVAAAQGRKTGGQSSARILATAHREGHRRPFLAGSSKRWYAAAAPSFDRAHLWSACIWADALHEVLAIPHQTHRQLVPALRDVPVWVTEKQVPQAVRPMLQAGIPVAVLARAEFQNAAFGERPMDVKGLREAEAMGATVVLWTDSELDAEENLRLAWEVDLHPVAWVGPPGRDNPFHLRIAEDGDSPPFSAGGLLPAPISISDAGYITADDLERLRMQLVVRDAVAVISFSLWAPRDPFLRFLRARESEGWHRADLRELGMLVTHPRRVMVSGSTPVRLPWRTPTRLRVMGPRWDLREEKTLPAQAQVTPSPPPSGVAILDPVREEHKAAPIKGVTLDPWPYGWQGLSARVLAESLAERYTRNGVNTVFFYAYNVKQGAAYWTRYPGATVSLWGKQDLLKEVLEACHARGIRVIAWMYSGRDQGMWTKHPSWRERTKDGQAYNPLRLHATYFLCPQHPEVREWYAGLLRDLAQRYPTLDGIELSEPLVNWWGDTACYCDVCRREFASHYPGKPLGGSEWRQQRTKGLTRFLVECMKAISDQGVDAYILTICDAWDNGALLTPGRQAEESGFDLDALLDSPYPPDCVNFEVIWQQWAALYGTQFFNYDWAAQTAQQLKNRVDGRARTIIHVEITDFGNQHMTPEKTAETIRHVMKAHPDGVECYHSAALDRKSAWTVMRRAYEEIK